MRAFRVHQINSQIQTRLVEIQLSDLSPGDVVIQAAYSSINYKDALAVTGKGKILKKFPLVAGIDVSGIVVESQNSRFKKGDNVLVTGCGIGESSDGGYAEFVKVSAQHVIPLPANLTLHEAMVLGTAGFSAALAVHRLRQNGLKPHQGPVLVTGASGGVGVFAVQILKKLGFEVIAVSGKSALHGKLHEFGAHSVVTPNQLALGERPLESSRYAAAIDNVGGDLLSRLVSHIHLWGSIACVGLAGGADLSTTIMPLILRGVSLLGISSNNCPLELRQQLWHSLSTDWRPQALNETISQEVPLSHLKVDIFEELIERRSYGRKIINCRR